MDPHPGRPPAIDTGEHHPPSRPAEPSRPRCTRAPKRCDARTSPPVTAWSTSSRSTTPSAPSRPWSTGSRRSCCSPSAARSPAAPPACATTATATQANDSSSSSPCSRSPTPRSSGPPARSGAATPRSPTSTADPPTPEPGEHRDPELQDRPGRDVRVAAVPVLRAQDRLRGLASGRRPPRTVSPSGRPSSSPGSASSAGPPTRSSRSGSPPSSSPAPTSPPPPRSS